MAAGSGKRMRPLSDKIHKTLLQVQGRSIIQWIVDALLENGITDLVIVTGYQAASIRAHLAEVYPSLNITYIHNERYEQTNNIYSMAMALNGITIDGEVVLIECDLIFEPAVIKRLLASPRSNIALVDRYRSGMDGSVVSISEGVITEVITPDRQGPGFVLEDKYKTLNIYRFSKEFCSGPFKKLVTYYASAISDNVYYELVLGIIIYLQHATIHAETLQGERWAELDDPNDVNLARFQFDPSVRKATLARSFGGHWNYDIQDFCFIRNMYFPTWAVLSQLRGNLPALLQNYGSSQEVLDEKMAYFLLCRPEAVHALNGVSQLYPWLQHCFEGCKPLICKPTFGEYSRIFPHAETYSDEVGMAVDEIAARAQGCDLLVLTTPNNPTGSVLPTAWIHEYAAGHPDKTIIVDESFGDFSDEPSLLQMLEAQPLPNVILLKSLSKALGVPGLRLGYVYTTNPRFSDYMRTAVPIWNLNSMAEYFLEIIVKYRPVMQASFARTKADRVAFAAELRELPIVKTVYPSGGNFLLVALCLSREETGSLVEGLMLRQGLYVKDVSSRFQGTEGYLRLAVRLPAENSVLVRCLGLEGSLLRPVRSC